MGAGALFVFNVHVCLCLKGVVSQHWQSQLLYVDG